MSAVLFVMERLLAGMSYSSLAPFYDLLGWADFTYHLWPHIREFFDRRGSIPNRFLDIACGTGLLASILARENVHVTGVDICEEMIGEARKRKYARKSSFHVADMRNFEIGERFPVTGCFYDSINHLASENEVCEAFESAYRHTEPGGYYLFDINTASGLTNWAPYCSQRKNRFVVTQECRYDSESQTGDIKVEAFVKDRGGQVRYICQHIRERAYPLTFIQNALAETGFTRLAFEPFMHDGTIRTAGRLFAICRK